MKILFVYPNIQRGARTPQLGICSLSAVLKLHGHDCDLYDTTLVEPGQEQTSFVQKLEDFQPQLVAFSIRSNEVRMVRLLKKLIPEGITVVAGGHHATVATQEMMETFDIVVQGEGEYALLELVEKLEKGESLKDVQNVWVRENGVVHKNSLRPLIDLDELPFPDWQIFDEVHFTSHYLKGGVASGADIVGTFEGSRGCIFTCTYCSSPHLMNMYGGKSWRREKSPERMAKEVHALKKLLGGLDYIYFVDEIFLTQRPRLERFRDVFSSQVNIPFTFMERPELITEEKMKLISEAGAAAVAIGVESGDEEFRKETLDRKTTQGKVIEAFRLAKKYGLHTHAFNMVGLPGETADVLRKNFELLAEIQPDSFQVTIFYPLKGTVLHDYCKEKGYLTDDEMPENYYESTVLELPTLKKEQIVLFQILMSGFAGRGDRLSRWLFQACVALTQGRPRVLKLVVYLLRVGIYIRDQLRWYGLWGSLQKVIKTRNLGKAFPTLWTRAETEPPSDVDTEQMIQVNRGTDAIYEQPQMRRPAQSGS